MVKTKYVYIGRSHYFEISISVTAYSKMEAAYIARNFNKLRPLHKDAILNVAQISKDDYDVLSKDNSGYLLLQKNRICENELMLKEKCS